jgi:hypothetical protein
MLTTIRISLGELTTSWLKKVKALFENEEELEIIIKPVIRSGLFVSETREEYVSRVNKAIENLETGSDTVSFPEDGFETLTNDLMKGK